VSKTRPSFTDLYAPKHTGIEDLKKRLAPVPYGGLAQVAPAEGPRPTSPTLLEFYLGKDLRQIYDDMRARPDHYDERQKAIIEHLVNQVAVDMAVTDREKDDLLLHWMRPSEVASKSQDLVRRLSDARHRKEQEDKENEEIIMEDGQSLKDHLEGKPPEPGAPGEPTFEKQDFGDKIIF
jgi:hypothetical protein